MMNTLPTYLWFELFSFNFFKQPSMMALFQLGTFECAYSASPIVCSAIFFFFVNKLVFFIYQKRVLLYFFNYGS